MRLPVATRSLLALLAGWVLLATACSRGPEDTQRLLQDVTAGAILPMHASFVAGSSELQAAIGQFCAAPGDATYAQARAAWHAAMRDWQRLQAVRFGPVTDGNQAWKVQFWPDRNNLVARQLETLLAGEDALSAGRLAEASVVMQGLTAAEYLLFDANGGTLSQYLPAEARSARRCALLELVAANTLQVARRLQQGWAAGGGNFAGQFTNPGDDSLVFTDPEDSLAALLDSVLASVEIAKNDKLAEALGLRNEAGIAQPYAVEAWRSRTSMSLLIATVEGARHLYYAGSDAAVFGVDDLLRAQGAAQLADDIDRAFAEALGAAPRERVLFDAVSDPAGTKALQAYYEALSVLAGLLKNDLPPVLGITLGFNDKDGD